jgi:predicted metalloprotease with PDZ domain
MKESDDAGLAQIGYRVSPSDPGSHRFEVVLSVAAPAPDGQAFALPAWIPGSYLIRDFARNVLQVQARCGETPVAIEKLDKSSWRCAPCAGPLELLYEVYAYDLSVRGAYLDSTRGYFNGTSLLFCVQGQEATPCVLTLERPAGADYEHWRVANSMRTLEVDAAGFGRYRRGLRELIIIPSSSAS